MKIRLALLLVQAAILSGCASDPVKPESAMPSKETGTLSQDPIIREQINSTLDAWHLSASKGSEKEYFDQGMIAEGVFLGTDPDERWTREEFRAYAKPYFSKGKGWTLKANKRWLSVAKSGDVAWFEEDLESKEMGHARGSGVMIMEDSRWKVAQYNLSIPIPNDDLDEVRKLIDKRAKGKKKKSAVKKK